MSCVREIGRGDHDFRLIWSHYIDTEPVGNGCRERGSKPLPPDEKSDILPTEPSPPPRLAKVKDNIILLRRRENLEIGADDCGHLQQILRGIYLTQQDKLRFVIQGSWATINRQYPDIFYSIFILMKAGQS